MFTIEISGKQRIIEWAELNQLKKDILWIFDENTGQLNSPFVPVDSFKSNYWVYLTLTDEGPGLSDDIQFYMAGVLIITLCLKLEYIDTATGNQKVFGNTAIKYIDESVLAFIPKNKNQEKLKAIVLLGLSIAGSMTPMDLLNTDGYNHKDLGKLYSKLKWVDTTFIKSYFTSKSK